MRFSLKLQSALTVQLTILSLIIIIIIIENEKFFELKSKGYRDGIKRKETR